MLSPYFKQVRVILENPTSDAHCIKDPQDHLCLMTHWKDSQNSEAIILMVMDYNSKVIYIKISKGAISRRNQMQASGVLSQESMDRLNSSSSDV